MVVTAARAVIRRWAVLDEAVVLEGLVRVVGGRGREANMLLLLLLLVVDALLVGRGRYRDW